jgi:hypothetical protein
MRKALHAIGIREMRAYERHCQQYINVYREGHTGYTVAASADLKALANLSSPKPILPK